MSPGLSLILATAVKCPACEGLAPYKDTIINFYRSRDIDVISVKAPSTKGFDKTDNIPASLRKVLAWFPMFILLPTELVNSSDERAFFPFMRVFNGNINMSSYKVTSNREFSIRELKNHETFLQKYMNEVYPSLRAGPHTSSVSGISQASVDDVSVLSSRNISSSYEDVCPAYPVRPRYAN